MRDLARELFDAAIAAVAPGPAVRRALERDPTDAPRVHLLAIGKAAVPMMEAALQVVPERRRGRSLVVTNPENAREIAGVELHRAAHPVPDAAGLAAGHAVEALARAARQGECVLCLMSGGASALVPAPVEGITLSDKSAVSVVLLGAGMPIEEMNLIRQQLSRLKGGGLARLVAPAACRALIVSDVIGDDIRVIASGPTAAPLGSRSDARGLLETRCAWKLLPEAVRRHLAAPNVKFAPVLSDNTVIASNATAVAAMADMARKAGWAARIMAPPLLGDVAEAARRITADALSCQPGEALIYGGETTVRITGDGPGGRNQELALRVALSGTAGDWVFLAGGTDGRDGPTDAAGGLVDPGTATRIAAAGQDASGLLANNASNTALGAAGDLVVTGGTGTNVADVAVFLRKL